MAGDVAIGKITVFCEASNQPPATRRDVASVLMNRLHDGRWGSTLAAVCLKRMQFSEWDADLVDNKNLIRAAETPDGDPIMSDCENAVEDALSGALVDGTGNALFYHEASMSVYPDWTAKMTNLGQRGPFVFYTDRQTIS